MDASVLKYIIFGSIGLLVIAGIAYFALAKQIRICKNKEVTTRN